MTKIRKTICFITPDCKLGGAERVLQSMITSMLDDYNVKLVVLSGNIEDFNRYWTIECDVHFLDCKSTKYAGLGLFKLLLNLKPEYVLSSRYHSNLICLILSYCFNSVKFIIREPNMPSNHVMPTYFKYLIRFLYPRAHKIIAQTTAMKNELMAFYRLNNSKIEVITNPVDTNRIDELVQNQTDPFDRKDNTLFIVAVGRLVEDKGFDVLIKSIFDLRKYNIHLYILGDGPCRLNLEKLIFELDLQSYVTLTGFVDNPYRYIKFADIFVLSSRKEGLPNVLLESIYLKKKIVATECVPFVREVLENHLCAKIVSVDSAEELTSCIEYFLINDIEVKYNYTFNKFDYNKIFL